MNKIDIQFDLNGKTTNANTYPMARLLDVIREDAELTGTKEGCGEGECGACSIFMDGKLVNSCLVPALRADKKKIETVESLPVKQHFRKFNNHFLSMVVLSAEFARPEC